MNKTYILANLDHQKNLERSSITYELKVKPGNALCGGECLSISCRPYNKLAPKPTYDLRLSSKKCRKKDSY